MKANAFKQPATWRAIFAAVALLFASLSPSLSLSASEPEFCEMACCMAEGHCCCAARKPWVKGKKPDDRPIIEPVEIRSQSGCPCVAPSSSNCVPRETACPAAPGSGLARRHVFAYHSPPLPRHSIWFTPTAPRAPPSLFIQI
ncbi:MAG: hypothetical protein ACREBD_31565 [Blastocatellia bacterium]